MSGPSAHARAFLNIQELGLRIVSTHPRFGDLFEAGMPRGVEDPGKSFASWVARARWNNGSVCAPALEQIRCNNAPKTIRYDSHSRDSEHPPASARLRTSPESLHSRPISPRQQTSLLPQSSLRPPCPSLPSYPKCISALSPAARHLVTTHPTRPQQRGPHAAVMRSLAVPPTIVCTFPRRKLAEHRAPFRCQNHGSSTFRLRSLYPVIKSQRQE